MNLRERAQFALIDRKAEEARYLEHVAACLVEEILETRSYDLDVIEHDFRRRTVDFELEGIQFRAQCEDKTRIDNGRSVVDGEERKLWYLRPNPGGKATSIPIRELADLGVALDSPLTGPESD